MKLYFTSKTQVSKPLMKGKRADETKESSAISSSKNNFQGKPTLKELLSGKYKFKPLRVATHILPELSS